MLIHPMSGAVTPAGCEDVFYCDFDRKEHSDEKDSCGISEDESQG